MYLIDLSNFLFYPMINSYEIKKTLYLNCLYSITYLFEDKI
jgi:hypothetical protein